MTVRSRFDGECARDLPGRRVAGAGLLDAANGFCVTVVGTESFDDLDMMENLLSRVGVLREPLPNRLNGIFLLCEERFVDDIVVG